MDSAARTITGENLNHTAFPLGGLGAGMVCLEGNGALNHLSIRHEPELYHDPNIFATLHIKGEQPVTRVLEGPVQDWKIFGPAKSEGLGNGAGGHSYGLPRFRETAFSSRFPFTEVELTDPAIPLQARITGWSPFVPGDDEASCLPVAAMEYTLTNPSNKPLEAVLAVHSFQMVKSFNFTDGGMEILPAPHGFTITGADKKDEARTRFSLAVTIPDDAAVVDHAWFRGGWFDPLTIMWKNVSSGTLTENAPAENAPGASVQIPVQIEPGETKTIPVLLAWYAPGSTLRVGHDRKGSGPGACCCSPDADKETHRPWYASRFTGIDEVVRCWQDTYEELRKNSDTFSRTFHAADIPEEVTEAAGANLSILKSPTILRQYDGRLWAWEGCCDTKGCCHGSCTHVWNYAQALPHLFPALERSLRETELDECQDEKGHQNFRAPLPIGRPGHDFHAAADGQLGGIIKMYREWRISGDNSWLEKYWDKMTRSMEYCITTWDPRGKGVLEEPHHNTYDIEFWGPDGMCSGIYVNALDAMVLMGKVLDKDTARYAELRDKGKKYIEQELFNGEYFIQQITWKGLNAPAPDDPDTPGIMMNYSDEAKALLQKEGPKYQYGTGCLSDGVIGEYFAACAGLPGVLDKDKVKSHLQSVFKYNFKEDLTGHANPQRPGYAMEGEGGLLLCTWPHGGSLSLPFVYSNEVWTGIEYQVAAHLVMTGCRDEGLKIVRTLRKRHDGRVRNQFNEYECGHWYARALASYALIQACSGIRYDAVEKALYITPAADGDFSSFLSTATGFGLAGVKDGKPFVDVVSGKIDIDRMGSNDDI